MRLSHKEIKDNMDKDLEQVYEYIRQLPLDKITNRQIDVLVDRYVLGNQPSVNVHSKTVTSDHFPPNYTTNETDAWVLAKKLGLCVIPQSKGNNEFSWYATDVQKVSYQGDNIVVTGKGDTGYSADTMPMAVSLSALLSVGIDLSAETPEEASTEKLLGTVKWFNTLEGHGFITDEEGRDIFVHFTAIIHDGYKKLDDGDNVEFELSESGRAKNVRKI